MLLERIAAWAETRCGLRRAAGPVTVAVSGGPDSLVLLDALHRLGYSLVVAHVDHGLRPESGREAAQVQALAAARGLPCVVERLRLPPGSGEGAAREARYAALFRVANSANAQALATGHTANDQTETLLIRLIQGTGPAGLRAMQPRTLLPRYHARIPLVRPLLGVWRDEVLAYCRERGLQPLFDPSNRDPRFLRNRVRHELLPLLEDLRPGAARRLWQLADILAAEEAFWQQHLSALESRLIATVGEGAWQLRLPNREALSVAEVRRLLVCLIHRAGGRPDFRGVEALRGLLAAGHGVRELAGGLRAVCDGATLTLQRTDRPAHAPQLPAGRPLSLNVPGEVVLAHGWRLSADLWPGSVAEALQSADAFTAFLDADRLRLPLQVRPRRPGDRFAPLGLGGRHRKVGDAFTDAKIPRPLRDAWPLVCSGEEIVWIPGLRPAHGPRLRPDTRRILRLRCTNPTNPTSATNQTNTTNPTNATT